MTFKTATALACAAAMAALAACDAPAPTPKLEPSVAPAPDTSATRTMSFRAENAGNAVAARCSVVGPGRNATFDTPARIDIPVGPDDRALISSVQCASGEDRAEWSGIPGPQTRAINARFGGTGLFGPVALIFGQSEGAVQYYARDGQLVTVGRAPAP